MSFLSDFEPSSLWSHFDQILKVPRGSKNEEAIRNYVVEVARFHHLSYRQDQAGNLVIVKPGHPDGTSETVVLQCHLDMVNEKNSDHEHDFLKDPIVPLREDGYLTADGTTLGADNGIGIATCLAILEDDTLKHPPLELLFTVDEETGLTGATKLDPDLLAGTRLINLDSEEENSIYIGCAGGSGVNLSLPISRTAVAEDAELLRIEMKGLRGGHSGVDIHLQRANAIKLLARLLYKSFKEYPFDLLDLKGGNMHNAIPREAFATVVLEAGHLQPFRQLLKKTFGSIKKEYEAVDPDMELVLSTGGERSDRIAEESKLKTLYLLHALPHGVIAMSKDIPGLVETSANLATAELSSHHFQIHVSTRSSLRSALDALQEHIEVIGKSAGSQVDWIEGYPGWTPDLESPLLEIAKNVHQEVLGVEPEIKAIHAGLECGIIKEKYPQMDMISVGPQIEFPHSPRERVSIDSVSRFYRFLCALLEALAQERLPQVELHHKNQG